MYEVFYENLVSGRYSFECILLYDEFVEDDIALITPNAFVSINELYFFDVSDSKSQSNMVSTEPCHLSEGEWIINDSDIMKYLEKYRIDGINDPWPPEHPLIYSLGPDYNFSNKLYFQPKQNWTNFINKGNNAALSCILQLNVCFWGDSQTRNLHNSAVMLLKNSSEVNLDILTSDPHAALKGHDKFHYYPKTYSGFQENVEELVSSSACQVVLANFGQWPAGWLEGYPTDNPWPFSKYEIQVEDDIAYLSQMQKRYPAAKIFWVTTNTFPLRDQTGTEWRIEPVLERYNLIAKNLAKKYGIGFINTRS
jgi:hypothetical protein